jgi:hypothetical protein
MLATTPATLSRQQPQDERQNHAQENAGREALRLNENVAGQPASPRRGIHGDKKQTTPRGTPMITNVRDIPDLSLAIIEDGD